MNWDAIGAIAEAVSAVGVVATLAYLAVQIRSNTLASRASAVHSSNLALRENREAIYTSVEVSQLYINGNNDPDALSEVDLVRYRIMMQNIVEALLDVYVQNLETGYAPETWRTQGVAATRRILGNAGGEWFWRNYSNSYPPSFSAEVDRVLFARVELEPRAEHSAVEQYQQ